MAKSRSPPKRAADDAQIRTGLELAEEAGERFDEACEHARRGAEHARLELGPTLPVPMSRLKPGRLAWSREIVGADGTGELYYVLEPKGSGREVPITGLPKDRIACDLRTSGPPAARLIGVVSGGAVPTGFGIFVDAVRTELGSTSE